MTEDESTIVASTSTSALRSKTARYADMEQHLVLDAKTERFVTRLHKLKEVSSTLSGYEKLRDEIFNETERISTHIATFAEVIKVVGDPEGWDTTEMDKARTDSKWAEFLKISKMVDSVESLDKKRKRLDGDMNQKEMTRRRNFTTLAALWSPRLAKYYEWYCASQRQMRLLCMCAREYPDFYRDFVPLANTVLLARQRASLLDNKVERIGEPSRTAHEGKLEPKFPLLYQDLQHLAHLKENKSARVYGQELTKSSVLDAEELASWTSSKDGDILIARDTTVRSKRPLHYHRFLLEQDIHGLLQVRRSLPSSIPEPATKRSNKESSTRNLLEPCTGERSANIGSTRNSDKHSVNQQANLLNTTIADQEMDSATVLSSDHPTPQAQTCHMVTLREGPQSAL